MKKMVILGMVIIMLFGLTSCTIKGFSASEADKKLLQAIDYGNLEACKEALTDGAHINELVGQIGERTDNGKLEKNPFRIACFLGNIRLATFLMEQGANPNSIDADGMPIICYVAKMGNIDLCKLLLDKGANINQSGKNGITSLDSCFIQDNSGFPDYKRDFTVNQMYDFLVTNGADVTTNTLKITLSGLNNDGYSNYIAIRKITEKLVKLNKPTGIDPLLQAIIMSDKPNIQALIQKNARLDNRDMFFAAAFSTPDVLNLLIDRGLSIKNKDAKNETLLTIAAKSGNLDMLQFLIHKFNLQGDDGYCALLAAASSNQTESVKMLIDNKAKIMSNNTVDFVGGVVGDMLSYACMNGNSDMVKVLIDGGYPKDGYAQAFQIAAKYDRITSLSLLISAGADINVEFNGTTALNLASLFGNFDIVKFLISNHAYVKGKNDILSPLSNASLGGCSDVANYLIEQNADINASPANDSGGSPLYQAVTSGSLDIVKNLVNHGARIDANLLSFAKVQGSNNVYQYLKSVYIK